MLWTWFLARVNYVRLPATAVLAMGLAVWTLYAADRLLDARLASARFAPEDPTDLEPRHHFHRRNQRSFRFGIVLASMGLAFLLPGLAGQSIHLYLILGAFLFAYFILIHAGPSAMGRDTRLPKELAVGAFFSAATFIPTVAREPSLRAVLLPAALFFAVVCSLNCLFIYAWEHPQATSRAHPATRIAVLYLPRIAVAAALSGILIAVTLHRLPWPIPAACSATAALLLLLHRNRHRLAPTTLRAAADLCLLTPLLVMPVWLH